MKTVQKLFYNLNYQIFIKYIYIYIFGGNGNLFKYLKFFESSNDAEANPFGAIINKIMLLLYYFNVF